MNTMSLFITVQFSNVLSIKKIEIYILIKCLFYISNNSTSTLLEIIHFSAISKMFEKSFHQRKKNGRFPIGYRVVLFLKPVSFLL